MTDPFKAWSRAGGLQLCLDSRMSRMARAGNGRRLAWGVEGRYPVEPGSFYLNVLVASGRGGGARP